MKTIPLAEEMRPKSLIEIIGQDHLLSENGIIYRTIQSGHPLSIILWGPPGCGKTSIARLYAKAFNMHFVSISAIFSGIAEIKKIIKEAQEQPLFKSHTLLFVDEIHRFNKAQQDAFLPLIENGTLTLVGATAENPSFYLNAALLSRVRVLPVYSLQTADLLNLLTNFEKVKHPLLLTEEARLLLVSLAQGDGRYLYNLIENICNLSPTEILDKTRLQEVLQRKTALFDRDGDQHYNLISALHKSVRGSDPDAALYWLARLLVGGEDPLFIARRLIRMATEDIGLGDPQALLITIAAKNSYEFLGSPEGELALAEAVIYLALAPKTHSIYKAYNRAREIATETSHLPPPLHLLNASTSLMKKLGYGKGYLYDQEETDGFSGQNYFPEDLERIDFYQPAKRGFEREMIKRLNYFQNLRNKKNH